jgi:perosamine synthetase
MNSFSSWPNWPIYGSLELEAVSRVIKSNQLFAASEVKAFEDEFAHFQGSRFAVGMGNATQGLQLALAASNIGEGHEVIVTPISWISSASCILMQNAVPIFVDIESESLGLDPRLVEGAITPRTKAIIAVHYLGYPSKIVELVEIAKRRNLILIEDASHAPGAELKGKKLGTFGDMGVFSLHQRKAISTGDGGIICTDNVNYAEKIRKLRSFGHEELSYNYRMTEFSASLGRVGLQKLESDNLQREEAAIYLHSLLSSEGWIRVRLVRRDLGEKGAYHAIALELNVSDKESALILDYFTNKGVPMRKGFTPLNKHPHFSNATPAARGRPWLNATYEGKMKEIHYQDLCLPVADEFGNGRILELYAHPGVLKSHLESFAEEIAEVYKHKCDSKGRTSW